MTIEERFQRALAFTLQWEGGYVNDPEDPGGATNFGITQTTYTAWQRAKRLAIKAVAKITRQEVGEIYRSRYWERCRCDEIPSWKAAAALFDYAVNSGPDRAIRHLQSALGVEADGIIGPKTLAALRKLSREPITEDFVCGGYLKKRLSFLRSLRHWPRFGRGWTNRVLALADLLGEEVRQYV